MSDLTGVGWKWLADYATKQWSEVKGQIAAAMNANDDVKKTVRVDGVKVADVTIPQNKAKAAVTNETAFIAWCARHYPGLLETIEVPATTVTQVKLDAVNDFLKGIEETGGFDTRTGMEPDGVTFTPEQPATWPKVTFTKDAGEVILTALRSGTLPMLTQSKTSTTEEGGA